MSKFILSALCAVLVSAKTPSFNDATYLAKSRQDKLDQIMTEVGLSTKSHSWPNSV